MPVAENRGPDAATLDLWRVAENGDLGELASVLQRVPDINARNEHGVTALMRAAQFGHVRMVRALLRYGADANITRNDKFTALALAAFFGHTEIVRVLMEHGADSQASTRHGTSPHMWATARTFNEVVDQLEKPAPPEKAAPPQIDAQMAPVFADPVARTAVRTLTDPPEIWDLVHEVSRGFNARSAFFSRLMETGLAFRLAAFAVLIGACVVGVLVFQRVQREKATTDVTSTTTSSSAGAATANVPVAPAATTNATDAAAPNGETPPADLSVVNPADTPPIVTRRRGPRSWRASSHRVEPEPAKSAVNTKAAQPNTTTNEISDLQSQSESAAKLKTSSSLSPQLIAPAKTATSKGKVIQWP